METENIQSTQEADTKWYVLRVVSGKERKVKEYLDKEVSRSGWDKIVKQVFLPVEKVYKVKYFIPNCPDASTISRTEWTPCLCPKVLSLLRSSAQRPLPSIIIAT